MTEEEKDLIDLEVASFMTACAAGVDALKALLQRERLRRMEQEAATARVVEEDGETGGIGGELRPGSRPAHEYAAVTFLFERLKAVTEIAETMQVTVVRRVFPYCVIYQKSGLPESTCVHLHDRAVSSIVEPCTLGGTNPQLIGIYIHARLTRRTNANRYIQSLYSFVFKGVLRQPFAPLKPLHRIHRTHCLAPLAPLPRPPMIEPKLFRIALPHDH